MNIFYVSINISINIEYFQMNIVNEYTEALSKRLTEETGRPPDPAPALDHDNTIHPDNKPGIQPSQPGIQPSQPGMQPNLPSTQTSHVGMQPGLPGSQLTQSGSQPNVPGTQPIISGKEPSVPGFEPKLQSRLLEGDGNFIRAGSMEHDLQIRAIEQNVVMANELRGKHNIAMSNVLGGTHLPAAVSHTGNVQHMGNTQISESAHHRQPNVVQVNSAVTAPAHVHNPGVISVPPSAHIAHIVTPQTALGNTHSAPLSVNHTLTGSATMTTSSHVTNVTTNQASGLQHGPTNQGPGHPGTHAPGNIPGNVPYFYPGMVPRTFLPSSTTSSSTGRGYIPQNLGNELSLRDLHHFTQLS